MIDRAQPTKPFTIIRDGGSGINVLRGSVIAIGNFDGVHRGHRIVVDAAIRKARMLGRPAAALTFEPHPRRFLRPHEPLFRLTDERTKLRLLAGAGLDGALVMTFNAALASLTAEQFIQRILTERLAISGATIGFDFHFGKDRGGSPAFLVSEGKRLGFPVEILPPLEDEGRPVSSSAIRTALALGHVVEAAELLGFPWLVSGTVIHGEKRGRDLGFPTANLRLDPQCDLKHGIYAVRINISGRSHDGVASFGRRPTFDNGAPLLEVFVFDLARELYGEIIDVAFIGWIRAEMQFAGVQTLIEKMHEDSRLARAILARTPQGFPSLGLVG